MPAMMRVMIEQVRKDIAEQAANILNLSGVIPDAIPCLQTRFCP
jgi:hypothetical protein